MALSKEKKKMKFQQLKTKKNFQCQKTWYFIFTDIYQALVPNKHPAEKDVFVKDWAPAASKILVTPQMPPQQSPHTVLEDKSLNPCYSL